MHLDGYVALAALIVGFVVGLTGMGGGALMTPILVLLFKIQPLAAVSSDLVAAMVMKPVGAAVHARRGTVNWSLVRWLMIGSVPSAFAGVFVLRLLGDSDGLQEHMKVFLGLTLMIACTTMLVKGWIDARRRGRPRTRSEIERELKIKRLPTVLIGAVGGLMVGMTSVGSGSVIIVTLLIIYPRLRAAQLVGTDLAQAIPLVMSAGLAHILFGDFELGLTASVLLGSLPGVYVGAKLSAHAPDGLIRAALVFVLLASGLKLLGVGSTELGIVMAVFSLLALPAWGALDAARRPEREWKMAGLNKRTWLRLQVVGAPFGVGFGAAIGYFAGARPKLETVVGRAEPAD